MITTVECTADSYVNSVSPNNNTGAFEEILIGRQTSFGFLRFDVPTELMNYDISSVKLYFFIRYSTNATRIRFHKVHDGWIEGTGTPYSPTTDGITYNNMPGVDSQYIEYYISSVPSGGAWHNVTITNQINQARYYGWSIRIRPNDDKVTYIRSRQSSYGRPYLEITYKLKTPILSANVERVKDGFKLSWARQQINYYKPSAYRIFKYNPNINEYILIKPTPSSTATVNGDTFEYIDREIVDYDYDYKYAIQARYHDEGTEKLTPFIFLDAGTLYKTESPQIEMAAVGGHTAMRHLINTKHSVHLDELNKIELSTWKKSLDATSISKDVDLRLTGDGNTLTKNILPIEDSNLGNIDNRWLEIHAEELKTDVSKTAKLRLWNGR